MNRNKEIVICIPTYKRQKELKRLLYSISKQKNINSKHIFETLIINNNNYDCRNINTILSQIKVFPFTINCIDVKERGYSNVRNAAVTWVLERNKDALIFVDDDEIVPPDWLSNMMKAWEKYGGDVITGPVRQVLPCSASRFAKKFHLFDSNYNLKSGEKLKYANTNNTLVSQRVFKDIGPTFHHLLNLSGGEDSLYFHRAYLKGYKIIWEESIAIEELTTPERATTAYILQRWFRYGMNTVDFHRILHKKEWVKNYLKSIVKVFVNLIKGGISSILRQDSKRFGDTVCRITWIGGNVYRLLRINIGKAK